MKILMVVGFIAVVTGFVIYALGSSLAPGEYPDFDGGITGPLARGAVSKVNHAVTLWKRPRGTATRKEREEMLVGTLAAGDEFSVLNHHQYGGQLWVQVVKKGDATQTGWFYSPAADPVQATRLN